jgi:hypothetical protein
MRKLITDRAEFPLCLRPFKKVKGICVGQCVCEFGKINGLAHAHQVNVPRKEMLAVVKKARQELLIASLLTEIPKLDSLGDEVMASTLNIKGWICLKWAYLLRSREILLHEAAHLLVGPDNDHGKVWRAKVKEIGGTYQPFEIRGYQVGGFSHAR